MAEGTPVGVTVTIPITFEQQVWVSVTAPLSEAGWRRFLEVLAFMKPGLVAPDAAVPTPDAPTSAAAPEPPHERTRCSAAP
jgi:hypothetical protein